MSFSWTAALKVLDVRKIPAELWLALALATGAVVLAPAPAAAVLGLEVLRNAHRPYIGAALVLSSAVLLAKALAFGGQLVKERVRRWRDSRQLLFLAPDQKAVLARYLSENTCTLNFGLNNGVAQGLEQVGLIYRSAQMGTMQKGFAYNIKPWLRVHLLKHPELVYAPAEARSA